MLSILFVVALFLEAKRKGYNPYCWALAAGPIGYGFLAFLPDLSPVMGRYPLNHAKIRKKGNRIGFCLTVVTVTVEVTFLAKIWSKMM